MTHLYIFTNIGIKANISQANPIVAAVQSPDTVRCSYMQMGHACWIKIPCIAMVPRLAGVYVFDLGGSSWTHSHCWFTLLCLDLISVRR